MTNPKQIPENEINARVAEALPASYLFELTADTAPFIPLSNKWQLCCLLMDNWEGITKILDEWFTYSDDIGGLPESLEWLWWEHSEYLANKEIWILRALVAYKENNQA